MSISVSWLAIQGRGREAMVEALGLEEVGDCSDCLSPDYACADLPGGWSVVVVNDSRFDLDKALKSASSETFAIGGEMSETVMCSRLSAFDGGRMSWSVAHDPDVDLNGVKVEGAPPEAFAAIQSRLAAKVAAEGTDEVDWMFDLPMDLSVSICGFRPDGDLRAEWTELALKAPKGKPRSGKKTSLRAEMKKELIPFMLARGWKEQTVFASDSPGNGFDFFRRIGGYKCEFWFDYSSSPDVWVSPGFCIEDFGGKEPRLIVQGNVRTPIQHIPFWKRLLGIEKPPPPPPPPEDPIADQIDRAKALVVDMEAFIDTGELRSTVTVSFRRGATSWPERRDTQAS